MKESKCFILGLLVALAAGAARAQLVRPPSAGEGQVSASGHVHLQRSPTHLRLYLQLTGKGKTLEEALAALRERREAAAAELEKLGVAKTALAFTPPGVDDSQLAQQRRMETMIAQRLGGRGAKKGAKKAKPPVAVTTWRYNPYAAREYEFVQQVAQTAGGEQQGSEAVAVKLDGIAFDFAVNATFAVETKK